MATPTAPTAGGIAAADPSRAQLEAGPFVLRTLLEDVPLSAEGTDEDIKINCVEFLDGNLYVGTSASEILHFVQIPPDPTDEHSTAAYIIASRLCPPYSPPANPSGAPLPGIQQILLLPQVGKACVLCNGTVSFYSLPELSPIFTQVKNCNWIGGVDLNEVNGDNASPASMVSILLSLNKRIRLVEIGENARAIKAIDFSGSTISIRRDTIACVADSKSYALLELERQLKIPLMTISSLDDSQPSAVLGQVQSIKASADGGLSRSASSATTRERLAPGDGSAHSRSTSLGNFMSGGNRRQGSPAPAPAADDIGAQVERASTPARDRSRSPAPPGGGSAPGSGRTSMDKELPAVPGSTGDSLAAQSAAAQDSAPPPPPKPGPVFLKPHIVSPTPEEFLLVTGTGPLDPGIGIFVNLDGDPTRPTLEFDRYPLEIVVDGGSSDLTSSRPSLGEDEEEGYVLASMTKDFPDGERHGIEVQRWDVNPGEADSSKHWLEPRGVDHAQPIGLRSVLSSNECHFREVVKRLSQQKFSPFSTATPPEPGSLNREDSRTAVSMAQVSEERDLFERDLDANEEPLPDGWEAKRNAEELEFATRLAKTKTRIAVWTGSRIWWALRNPLILQLEAGLEEHLTDDKLAPETKEERRQLFQVLNSFRGRDAKTELEFVTFSYIRQRAGALLFMSFLQAANAPFAEPESKALIEVLIEGRLDPRIILSLIPGLRNEIIQSRKGIWIYGGVKGTVQRYLSSDKAGHERQTISSLEPGTLHFLKRFLADWRNQKGFGSTPDENDVSRTVDAALLAVLLELDRNTPKGLAKGGSIRAELNELVDGGLDCFDRAVDLLEDYHRLYVISRLYQSRKMAGDVLATWRRIVEGERDDGGELQDGEQRVREYLSKVSSQALVQEYGLWLANRNPKLGVQVFADDKGRAPKFEPVQAVALLRHEAPDAVKYYLEHLVFGKGHTAYVNELITYYLDIVLNDLQANPASRDTVLATYEAYRALRPPKPTYRQFLTDNAPPADDVWQSRLRLLQLLGGAHDFDAAAIRARIAHAKLPADQPASRLLVPETIVLDGREQKHEDALRLLVHGLGDYDTAVSYCLRAGASIYIPSTPDPPSEKAPEPKDAAYQRRRLFAALLREFLAIEDISDRVEQTGALLERFGAHFDVLDVLQLIPDGWAVGVVAGFVASALRRLAAERRESAIVRALGGAENLRVAHELVVRVGEEGAKVEAE